MVVVAFSRRLVEIVDGGDDGGSRTNADVERAKQASNQASKQESKKTRKQESKKAVTLQRKQSPLFREEQWHVYHGSACPVSRNISSSEVITGRSVLVQKKTFQPMPSGLKRVRESMMLLSMHGFL